MYSTYSYIKLEYILYTRELVIMILRYDNAIMLSFHGFLNKLMVAMLIRAGSGHGTVGWLFWQESKML